MAVQEDVREQDVRAIKAMKDCHKGRPAFVFGAGTSLRQITSGQLYRLMSANVTFTVNYLTKWDALQRTIKAGVQPTYHCVSESDNLKQVAEEIAWWLECPRLYASAIGPADLGFDLWLSERWPNCPQWVWAYRRPHPPMGVNGWDFAPQPEQNTSMMENGDFLMEDGPQEGVPVFASGGTVIVDSAVQWAAWMGCAPIYLLGVDCDGRGHVYDGPGRNPNPLFDTLQNLLPLSLKTAAQYVPIINLSPESKLADVLLTQDLEGVLKNG